MSIATPKQLGAAGFCSTAHIITECIQKVFPASLTEATLQTLKVVSASSFAVLVLMLIWMLIPPVLRGVLYVHELAGRVTIKVRRRLRRAIRKQIQRVIFVFIKWLATCETQLRRERGRLQKLPLMRGVLQSE